MKKLIALLLAFVAVLTVLGCVCGSTQSGPTNRGTLTVAYDREQAADLLAYFQANQNVIVTGTALNDETDYAALADSAVFALVKDAATVDKLKAAGWTEAENWTDSQKQTNADMFNFTVLFAPSVSDASKTASKILTDWLVGEGTYERTITTTSGSCSCKRVETNVIMKSDAPALYQSGMFDDLKN